MAGRSKRTGTIGFDLNKLSQELRREVLDIGIEVLGELAEKVAVEANLRAPVIQEEPYGFQPLRRGPDKTSGSSSSGPMKGNVFAQESQKVPLSWLVVSPAWYSHFYEFGTSAHEMPRKSKIGKKMMFPGTGPFIGERVLTEHVKHPGVRARAFMRPAADKAEQFLSEILQKHGFTKKG